MEYNVSLSARIKRRNKQGFTGNGTGLGYNPYNKTYGDYTDPKQNHKDVDYNISKRRKARLRYKSAFRKKFADNHQKL